MTERFGRQNYSGLSKFNTNNYSFVTIDNVDGVNFDGDGSVEINGITYISEERFNSFYDEFLLLKKTNETFFKSDLQTVVLSEFGLGMNGSYVELGHRSLYVSHYHTEFREEENKAYIKYDNEKYQLLIAVQTLIENFHFKGLYLEVDKPVWCVLQVDTNPIIQETGKNLHTTYPLKFLSYVNISDPRISFQQN